MAPSQSPIISAQYNHLRGAHRIGGGQNGGQNGSSNNSSPRHLHHGQNGHSPSLGDYLFFFLKKNIKVKKNIFLLMSGRRNYPKGISSKPSGTPIVSQNLCFLETSNFGYFLHFLFC